MSDCSELDLAYLAGFFDGEGCIHMHTRSNGLDTLTIMLSNTCRESLNFMESLSSSGSISHVNRKSAKPQHSPVYMLQIHGDSAKKVLEAMLPYLKIKQKQANLAIAFQEVAGKSHGNHTVSLWEREVREILSKRITDLNHTIGHGSKIGGNN